MADLHGSANPPTGCLDQARLPGNLNGLGRDTDLEHHVLREDSSDVHGQTADDEPFEADSFHLQTIFGGRQVGDDHRSVV